MVVPGYGLTGLLPWSGPLGPGEPMNGSGFSFVAARVDLGLDVFLLCHSDLLKLAGLPWAMVQGRGSFQTGTDSTDAICTTPAAQSVLFSQKKQETY